MKPDTCLVIDVWEGQLEIDETALKQNGVAGIGIRINDMNGGHHMDGGFVKQWVEASGFVRFPYFVYNPWVNGAVNFAWLKEALPIDAGRVAIDIEVRYSGYSPNTYAGEVVKFLDLCKAACIPTIIYTAQWFLQYLSSWPRVDYWWAQYPNQDTYFSGVKTWDELKLRLDRLSTPFNANTIPGTLKMWQFSGDYLRLPGTARDIDVNIFYGTEAELAAYFGNTSVTPPPVTNYQPGIYRIKGDLEAGVEPVGTRPYIRHGLPSTVRMRADSLKSNCKLPPSWMAYVYNIQGNPNYQFSDINTLKPAVGWHNVGDADRVEYVVFSGNIVEVTGVVGERAYIKTVSTTDAPPASFVRTTELTLHPLVHMFSTQFKTWLDMSTNGKFPRTIVMAAPGERMSLDIRDLVYCPVVSINLTALPWLNVRSAPGGTVIGRKYPGASVTVFKTRKDGAGNLWGLIYGGWIALRYTNYKG